MRKIIYLAFVCLSVTWFASSASGQIAPGTGPRMGHKKMKAIPEIGSQVKPVAPLFKAPAYCVVGSASLYHCFIAVVDRISYQIAYVKSVTGKYVVAEVRTVDPHFKTPGGLSVGNVVTVRSSSDLTLTPMLAFDGRSDGHWLPILGEIPGPVIVLGPDGKDTWIGYDDLHLTGQPIRLKISGFVLGTEAPLVASHPQS